MVRDSVRAAIDSITSPMEAMASVTGVCGAKGDASVQRVALVTVTNQLYAPCTLTFVHSARTLMEFGGSIIVMHTPDVATDLIETLDATGATMLRVPPITPDCLTVSQSMSYAKLYMFTAPLFRCFDHVLLVDADTIFAASARQVVPLLVGKMTLEASSVLQRKHRSHDVPFSRDSDGLGAQMLACSYVHMRMCV